MDFLSRQLINRSNELFLSKRSFCSNDQAPAKQDENGQIARRPFPEDRVEHIYLSNNLMYSCTQGYKLRQIQWNL